MGEVKWPEISTKDAIKLIERMSEWIQDASWAINRDGLNDYHSIELDGLRQHIELFMPSEDRDG